MPKKRKLTPAQEAALAKGRGSGAGGRKPKPESEKRITVSFSLSSRVVAALELEADHRNDLSRSAVLEDLLRSHPAIRGWMEGPSEDEIVPRHEDES